MKMGDEPVGLAQRMNRVPGHPEYIYGLAIRSGENVEVDVAAPGGEILHVKGVGWAGENGIHAVAQRMIDEREAK